LTNRQYWLTVHWPDDTENPHENICIGTRKDKSRREMTSIAINLKKKILPGDLVFVYETKTGGGHTLGRQKIVDLVEVVDRDFTPKVDGHWITLRYTKFLGKVDCPQQDAKNIIGRAVGCRRPFGRPVPGTNVYRLSCAQAMSLLQCVCSKSLSKRLLREDFADEAEDEEYQRNARNLIDPDSPDGPESAVITNTSGSRRLKKDAKFAAKRHQISGYKCENCHQPPFKSQSNNKDYVEAHHLVPANPQTQEEFGVDHPLDNVHNIVSLCPNCHRLLHYALFRQKKPLLKRLFKIRRKELNSVGIHLTFVQLMKYY